MGAIIILGFVGVQIFDKTKIIEIPLLLIIGFLIGSVFHLVNPDTFSQLAGLIGAIALLIILVESGLNTQIEKLVSSSGKTIVETLSVMLVTILLVTLAVHYLFVYPFDQSVLIGIIIAGTGAAVILPIIGRLNISEEIKNILSMESILTTPIQIVLFLAVIQLMLNQSLSLSQTVNAILAQFSIAIVIGILAGLLWLKILKSLSQKPFAYMLTIAVALLLYGSNELINSSGAISVLVFALIIGNAQQIWRALNMEGEFKTPDNFRQFHSEITFFIKTFFFVYLGVLIQPQFFTVTSLLIGLTVTLIIVIARFVTIKYFFLKIFTKLKGSLEVMTGMCPRGLTEAVLVVIPASYGINIPYLLEIAFTVLILTNIITTIEILRSEKTGKPVPRIVK